MKISELKERKKELGYSNKMISDISGIPVSTLQKIFGGSTETPRYETLLKLERALFPTDRELRQYDPYYMPDGSMYKMHVEESPGEYSAESFYGYDKDYVVSNKRQGHYTLEDYYNLPDDIRVELIDGVFYDMASPSRIHQAIITELVTQISPVLDASDADCIAFVSPLDVQFENDNDDNLQPDLLIVCDKAKYDHEGYNILGAPDLVMEVLSPSSRAKDRIIKLNKYLEKGVREYWIIDPELKEIHVYHFDGSASFFRYNFEDRIPLHIFDGKISVSFAAITRKLKKLGFDSPVDNEDAASVSDSDDDNPPAV